MAAITLFSVPVQAQQVSDEVLPEAKTVLATKFEFLSPEVAASLAAKARSEPILAKDSLVGGHDANVWRWVRDGGCESPQRPHAHELIVGS